MTKEHDDNARVRVATPEEVAKAKAWLASSHVTIEFDVCPGDLRYSVDDLLVNLAQYASAVFGIEKFDTTVEPNGHVPTDEELARLRNSKPPDVPNFSVDVPKEELKP